MPADFALFALFAFGVVGALLSSRAAATLRVAVNTAAQAAAAVLWTSVTAIYYLHPDVSFFKPLFALFLG